MCPCLRIYSWASLPIADVIDLTVLPDSAVLMATSQSLYRVEQKRAPVRIAGRPQITPVNDGDDDDDEISKVRHRFL
jgi:hypothetical protein